MKNKTDRSKLTAFELLVNNIIATKFVVLSTLIESNFILRRAKTITENLNKIQAKNAH